MDKSWMKIENRLSDKYQEGVQSFIEFAEKNATPGTDMRCPCTECSNVERKPTKLIKFHLIRHGIKPTYVVWRHHGEIGDNEQIVNTSNLLEEDIVIDDVSSEDDEEKDKLDEMIEDIFMGTLENDEFGVSTDDVESDSVHKFFNLLDDVQRELYPGCNEFTILSFVIKMFHMKVLFKWSDTSFNELLKVLKPLQPNCDKKVLWTLYETKKFLRDLGLGYEVIHACKYDCALFWKENAKLNECPVCKTPSYVNNDGSGKRIPHKVLRYFPLTPRLKRLFMSRKPARDARWHKEKRVNDGILRHPADGQEWKEFDQRYPLFAADSRNVRLGLASDGFNPFGEEYSTKSVWPVIVTPYNLPPWKCMKEPYCFMSSLFLGLRHWGEILMFICDHS